MNYFLLIIIILTLFNFIKSNIVEYEQMNTFGKILFQRLGIEKKYTGLNLNKNRIRKSIKNNSIYHNQTQLETHMYNLYYSSSLSHNSTRNRVKSKNDFRKSFNMIRSFGLNLFNSSNKSSLKFKTIRLNNLKNKYLQMFEMNQLFEIDLNSLYNNKETIMKAHLVFNLNTSSLIKNKIKHILRRPNKNIYNQLNLKLILTILNETKPKKNIRLISSIKLNYTLSEYFNSNYSIVRQNNFKFNLKKILKNFNNLNNIKLDVKLNVEFISGLKACELNKNLKYLSDLFIDKPLLTIYSKDIGSSKLLFDNSNQPMTKFKSSKCERKMLTIDFRELGWDHVIIEPKILKTYYCDGKCNIPLDDSSNVSNHAILQSLLGQTNQFNYLPKVCCTPSKYKSHFFLILDENDSIALKKLDDIIVDSCSCK